jgi:ribulose-phosphate 3-epimerase
MTNVLTNPPRLPLISASILSADFSQMGKEARSALDAGADLLHFDVMDGHFVGNLTMGPDMCRAIRGKLPESFFDVWSRSPPPVPTTSRFITRPTASRRT